MVDLRHMNRPSFVNGEIYHIYNRGVDKRNIFSDQRDLHRFLQSMEEFNSIKPIGSIYERSFLDPSARGKLRSKKLVEFVCYCLNPNHFHFVLKQISGGGISEFMKRLGGGYTWYFNNKQKRNGSLFQGTFKAVHVDKNNYLLHLSAYVNLNNLVHKLGGETAKFVANSWGEYSEGQTGFTKKDIILSQFSEASEYKKFALDSLQDILKRKELFKEMKDALLEEATWR